MRTYPRASERTVDRDRRRTDPGGDQDASNLLLEDGNDILLEDGGFLLLDYYPPGPNLLLDFAKVGFLDPRITFTRASQATLFDSTGTLKYAKHNLLLQSQDFGTTWIKVDATITSNTIVAPDGTLTGDKLVLDNGDTAGYVSQSNSYTSGTAYTFSCFAKQGEETDFRIITPVSAFTFSLTAVFDLSTGTVTSVTSGGTATITPVGNGWYRCSLTATATSTTTGFCQFRSNYTGDGTSGLFIWGAQLNLSNMEGGVTSSLDTYYPTTTAAYYAPRFDHDPTTGEALGLLIEEQRTNSIRNNTMQGAVAGTPGTLPTNWAYGQLSTLTTEIVGTGIESGITYIDIRISGTATTTALIYFESNSTVAATNNQSWATSVFVKIVGGGTTNITKTATTLRMSDSGGVNLGFLGGSSITLPTSGTSLSACRFSSSHTTNNASTAFVMPAFALTAAGAIDITLRIGLPQLELGAFATSVISTTSASATRNADDASMVGTNFSSWFNNAEGTFYIDWRRDTTSKAAAGGASSVPRIFATGSSGAGVQQLRLFSSTGAEVTGPSTYMASTWAVNEQNKHAIAYKVNDNAVVRNGGAAATDTTSTAVTGVDMFSLGQNTSGTGNAGQLFIKKFAYYPQRLTNAQLQALTG